MKPVARPIRLRGVRVHNLKGIDLDLPTNRLTVLTGVSGSGKSSLAFDTLYAEGQRRYIETFSAYTRQFLERLDKPDADRIDGIPPAIAVGQRQGKRASRSTVGTVTEVMDHLGLLFARAGRVVCRNCGSAVDAAGPEHVTRWLDDLPVGTRYLVGFPVEVRDETDLGGLFESFRAEGFARIRVDGKVVRLDEASVTRPESGVIEVIVDRLVRDSESLGRRLDSIETSFSKGLGRCRIVVDGGETLTFYRGRRCPSCGLDAPDPDPRLFRYNSPLGACPTCEGYGRVIDPQRSDAAAQNTCPTCDGTRLRIEARFIRLGERDITEVVAMTIADADKFLGGLHDVADLMIQRTIEPIRKRLDYLMRIGLHYLTLDRPARSLSMGESRRVALTSALGSGLVNTLYVLDEPSIGLHPRDIGRLIEIVHDLRDTGNTVVVVEHDEDIMRAADRLVDIGPGAGQNGGRVIYEGPPEGIGEVAESLTGQFLSGRKRIKVPVRRRTPSGHLMLKGARGHNLKEINVSFPLGVFCVVTGVSGAGKSSLVEGTLLPALRHFLERESLAGLPYEELSGANALDRVLLLDQSPIGRTPRSNPATFLKAFDEIRKTFAATHEAKARKYPPSRFSFNVEEGRCSTCEGIGQLVVDMKFLADVTMRCPDCLGRRYRAEVLEVEYRGKSISDVLDLTARETLSHFRTRPKVLARLRPLIDVGLDYLRLGQSASTLSGGEAQRLKLASFLASTPSAMARASSGPKTLFILDEPTTGLHPADTLKLVEALDSLLALGHSLLIVEHNPDVMACADWLIDLGPEAGEAGGRVVAVGTPEEVAKSGTATGKVLASLLGR